MLIVDNRLCEDSFQYDSLTRDRALGQREDELIDLQEIWEYCRENAECLQCDVEKLYHTEVEPGISLEEWLFCEAGTGDKDVRDVLLYMLGEIRDRKGLTGAEKLRELFRTAVLQDYQQQLLGMMPCLLDNPKFLALLIRSVLDDAAPNYVQPILEEGMADGSIQTDSPRQLAQARLLLTDLWAAPILQPVPPEEVRSRCLFLNQLTRPFGFELMDEELIRQLESYWRA